MYCNKVLISVYFSIYHGWNKETAWRYKWKKLTE